MPATTGSLRTKLVLWFALVFLAIDAGLVAALSIVRRDAFAVELFDEVRTWTVGYVNNLIIQNQEWTVESPALARELESVFPIARFDPDQFPAGVILRDDQRRVIGSSRVLDATALPVDVNAIVTQGPLTERRSVVSAEVALAALGVEAPHTVLTMPIYWSQPVPRIGHIQIVFPSELVRPSLADFAGLIIFGIVFGGAFAVLAAWWLAGRVVAPIEQLARAAREVRPDRIGERIRVDPTNAEMAELQRELNEALARLELGYRAQERFIGDVSHELRTPLAVLLAEAGLIPQQESDVTRYRNFVDSTEEELRRLARLVEGFLRLTRVEMTREPLLREAVEVNDLVVDATRHVEGYARRASVHLVPNLALPDDDGEGPVVRGDPELLRTMLENLLRNAVRFSPTGAPVQIAVERDEEDVRIVVRDRGPGIPPDNLERVFQRFVRLEQDGEREKGGSGIGLAIARNVAVLHRGDIRASNDEAGGCVMTVFLPSGEGGEGESDAADAAEPDSRRA